MINYYLETYKNWRKEKPIQNDYKLRLWIAILMLLIPSIIMLGNLLVISIYELYNKHEICTPWKIGTAISVGVYALFVTIASLYDNRWRSNSRFLNYSNRIEKLFLLKNMLETEYKFNNNLQYSTVIKKIIDEKHNIENSSNSWLNKWKKIFFSLFIVIFVALTPATITGLMNNYGKKENELINRMEFLDKFAVIIFMSLFLFLITIVIGIFFGFLYYSIGKKQIRILEDFEEDMRLLIEIDDGLHPLATEIKKGMCRKRNENDEKYKIHAKESREEIDNIKLPNNN
ncbi:hypothetical protein [Ruminococcus sp.]|uniref:hypothetical protein n=1 Tax=Ruminococcus sp. TaxID=41978 RepID=UPI0025F47A3A|nr:hypothetical protein [Ruminococcus sp.]MBR1432206.1 hypothetical protein [Ruminococcus sp.]